MKAIMKDVSIRNYQGIVKADFELVPGTNVFIGGTDTGKSSLIRALRDWMYNTVGDAHVTAGAEVAEVTVDDVMWRKGKKDNEYIIGDKVYSKVGRGAVPTEVQDVTGIRDVEFGEGVTRRLNIVEQFGPEFIVGEKTSENAKVIGSLSGIHVIFNALREATADHKRAQKDVNTFEERKTDAELKVKSFAYIGDVVDLLEKVGKRIDSLTEKAAVNKRMTKLFDDKVTCEADIKRAANSMKAHKSLASVSFDKYDSLYAKLHSMKTLQEEYVESEGEIDTLAASMKELKKLKAVSFDKIDSLTVKLDQLEDLNDKYIAAALTVELEDVKTDEKKKVLDACRKDHTELIDGMDICPLTGETLPAECKEVLKG